MTTLKAERARARDRIVALAGSGLDADEYVRHVTSVLSRALPFDGSCILTVDPATLLPTREIVENGLPPESMVRLIEIEMGEPDVNKFTALARSPWRAAGLAQATDGNLERSRRQREVRRPNGFGDELRSVCSDATGTWGALTLLREQDRPHFTAAEVRFVASLSRTLAEGIRRATVLQDPGGTAGEDAGLVVLAADDTIEMSDRVADRLLAELAPSHGPTSALPVVVRSVATQARRDTGSANRARARVRTRSGRWLVVRGSRLDARSDGRVSVLVEEARPAELAPLIADAYGLSARERRVTELVARGFPTDEIADRAHVSPYTVQDQLKRIFEKTGSSTRGELVARLFFDHYAPRLTARSTG